MEKEIITFKFDCGCEYQIDKALLTLYNAKRGKYNFCSKCMNFDKYKHLSPKPYKKRMNQRYRALCKKFGFAK